MLVLVVMIVAVVVVLVVMVVLLVMVAVVMAVAVVVLVMVIISLRLTSLRTKVPHTVLTPIPAAQPRSPVQVSLASARAQRRM